MIPLIDRYQEPVAVPVLRLAFRPLFLLAALFACLAVAVWTGVLTRGWLFQPYGGSYWWHAHEMLFGFVVAVIAGFLLTAVKNWTGVPGIKGKALFALVAVWLAGRLLIALNSESLTWLTAVTDLAFLPIVAVCLARSVLKVKQYRNLIFVPLLLGMALSNGYMHWGVLQQEPQWLQTGSHAMVILVTAIMCVLGGRVFPMFTANGTGTPRVPPIPWLEKLSLASIGGLAIVFLVPVKLPSVVLAALLFIAGISHFSRWLRWRFWVTFTTPLVWSLHAAYVCIPMGLLLLALHYGFGTLSFSLAMHVITVGAMGGMILAMMSRVSLGHTGRKIQVGHWMTAAFLCLLLALFSRTLVLSLFVDPSLPLILSAVFWCAAYGMFFIKYAPILTQPRVDGAHE